MAIDSRQLRFFVEVATLGSINRAAEHLHIAQSALSRRMHQLEHDLGAILFDRSPSGVELTREGRRLLGRAIALGEGLGSLREVATSKSQSYPSDTMRIGMTPSSSHLLLGKLIPRASEAIPSAMLRVVEATGTAILNDLIGDDLELIVGRHLHPDKRLARRELWREALILVAPHGTLKSQRIERLPLVYPVKDSSIRKLIDQGISRVGLTPRSSVDVAPGTNVKQVILDGSVSVLPYSLMYREPEIERFDMVQLPDTWLETAIIWRVGRNWRDCVTHLAKLIEIITIEVCKKDRSGLLIPCIQTTPDTSDDPTEACQASLGNRPTAGPATEPTLLAPAPRRDRLHSDRADRAPPRRTDIQ